MRYQPFFCTLAACAVGTVMAGTANAGEHHTTAPAAEVRVSPHGATVSANTYRASKLIGSTVVDQAGETLGRISDLILNPTSGKADLAVISLDMPGHQTATGKLTAVPWPLVRFTGTDRATINVERSKLTAAPTFDVHQWPDFSRPDYNQRLYTYYGVTYPERPGMGGRVYVDEYESGTATSPELREPFPRPQPDGRMVFPELHKNRQDNP